MSGKAVISCFRAFHIGIICKTFSEFSPCPFAVFNEFTGVCLSENGNDVLVNGKRIAEGRMVKFGPAHRNKAVKVVFIVDDLKDRSAAPFFFVFVVDIIFEIGKTDKHTCSCGICPHIGNTGNDIAHKYACVRKRDKCMASLCGIVVKLDLAVEIVFDLIQTNLCEIGKFRIGNKAENVFVNKTVAFV